VLRTLEVSESSWWRREGHTIIRKRTERLWRDEGRPNHVWAIGFQFDETADRRRLKLCNIVDEHTRVARAMDVGRTCTADDVVTIVERLVAERGAPQHLRTDNGPEAADAARRDHEARTPQTTADYHRLGMPLLVRRPYSTDKLARVQPVAPGLMARLVELGRSSDDLLPDLQGVDCPVLVRTGGQRPGCDAGHGLCRDSPTPSSRGRAEVPGTAPVSDRSSREPGVWRYPHRSASPLVLGTVRCAWARRVRSQLASGFG
jgi:Integrase core domain